MSGWGDIAYRAAITNPEIVVVGDEESPVASREKRKATPTEAEEQAALFDWIRENAGVYPALRWAFHPANGEYRHPATAARLRSMGVRPGVPDVLLPHSAYDAGVDKTYTGLAIELKRADRSNKPTPEQTEWLSMLDSQDWRCVVCYGAQEAINVIRDYLDMED